MVVHTSDPSFSRPVGPEDVIFGRGGASNNHVGNRRYRSLVALRQAEYVRARKRDKAVIAREIVRTVTEEWGGMFVRRLEEAECPDIRPPMGVSTANRWVDVGEDRAREKTSQALREGLDVRSRAGVTGGGGGHSMAQAAAAHHIGGAEGAGLGLTSAPMLMPPLPPIHSTNRSPNKKRSALDEDGGSLSPGREDLEPDGDAMKRKRGRPPKKQQQYEQYQQHHHLGAPPYPTQQQQMQLPKIELAQHQLPTGGPTSTTVPIYAHPRAAPSQTLQQQQAAAQQAAARMARSSLSGQLRCGSCRGIVVAARACVPCGHVFCAPCDVAPESPPATLGDQSDDKKAVRGGVLCPTCRCKVSGSVPCEQLDRIVSLAVSGGVCDFTLEDLTSYEARWRDASRILEARRLAQAQRQQQQQEKEQQRQQEQEHQQQPQQEPQQQQAGMMAPQVQVKDAADAEHNGTATTVKRESTHV